jgi:hypothetical protein
MGLTLVLVNLFSFLFFSFNCMHWKLNKRFTWGTAQLHKLPAYPDLLWHTWLKCGLRNCFPGPMKPQLSAIHLRCCHAKDGTAPNCLEGKASNQRTAEWVRWGDTITHSRTRAITATESCEWLWNLFKKSTDEVYSATIRSFHCSTICPCTCKFPSSDSHEPKLAV